MNEVRTDQAEEIARLLLSRQKILPTERGPMGLTGVTSVVRHGIEEVKPEVFAPKSVPVIVEATYCHHAEDPGGWGTWRMVSFMRRHGGSEDPANYDPKYNVGIRRKLDCDTAFFVSCYDHGGLAYSLLGEGMQCRWDTTRYAGIILCDPKDLAGFKCTREEHARDWLNLYEAWANGYVFELRVTPDDGQDHTDDAAWHEVYGCENANAELKYALEEAERQWPHVNIKDITMTGEVSDVFT